MDWGALDNIISLETRKPVVRAPAPTFIADATPAADRLDLARDQCPWWAPLIWFALALGSWAMLWGLIELLKRAHL